MKKFSIISAVALLPTLAFAQDIGGSGGEPTLGNVSTLLTSIGKLVDLALPIVVAIALLGFFWGLAKFIFAAGNEVDQKKGKDLMIWSVVALFVMVSVWGLVRFIGRALGVGQGGEITVPDVPQPGN